MLALLLPLQRRCVTPRANRSLELDVFKLLQLCVGIGLGRSAAWTAEHAATRMLHEACRSRRYDQALEEWKQYHELIAVSQTIPGWIQADRLVKAMSCSTLHRRCYSKV